MRTGIYWVILSFVMFASQVCAQSSFPRLPSRILPDNQTQVDARIKTSSLEIPKNLSDLIVENNRVETDLITTNRDTSYLNDQIQKSKTARKDLSDLKENINKIRLTQCSDEESFQKLRSLFQESRDRVERSAPGPYPFALDFDDKVNCKDTKEIILRISDASLDSWVGSEDDISNKTKLLESNRELNSILQSRQANIRNALKKIEQTEFLTNYFPLFIALFGALSLGAIIVVSKLASEELQMEWVASGQITQFVTVMILMIVVTMLGLSRTINGETLGTLLGGVAGYVLAQGVGRAATRDATRIAGPK